MAAQTYARLSCFSHHSYGFSKFIVHFRGRSVSSYVHTKCFVVRVPTVSMSWNTIFFFQRNIIFESFSPGCVFPPYSCNVAFICHRCVLVRCIANFYSYVMDKCIRDDNFSNHSVNLLGMGIYS